LTDFFGKIKGIFGRNGSGRNGTATVQPGSPAYPLTSWNDKGQTLLDGRRVKIVRDLPRKDAGFAMGGDPRMTGRLISNASFFSPLSLQGMADDEPLDNPYKQLASVYSCTRAISVPICQVPLKVMKGKGDGEYEEVEGHPFGEVLYAPNAITSANLLKEFMVGSLCLNGEFFVYGVRQNPTQWPVALWPLPAMHMSYLPDPVTRLPVRWFYDPGGSADPIPFELWEIFHGKYWNPEDPVRGLAPWEAAKMSGLQDWDIKRYNRAFVKNSCDPGGHFEAGDYEPTDKQKRAFIQQFKDRHQGPSRAFDPMILGNLKWKPNQIPHKEMHFPEQNKLTLRDVMMVYGVKKTNLGLDDDINRSTANVQDSGLWHNTLLPITDLVEYSFWMLARFIDGGKHEILFDKGQVKALRKDIREDTGAVKDLWSCGVPMSQLNERFELGLNEYPGWDGSFIPTGMIPSGLAGANGTNGKASKAGEGEKSLPGAAATALLEGPRAAKSPGAPESDSDSLPPPAVPEDLEEYGAKFERDVVLPVQAKFQGKVERFWMAWRVEALRRFKKATGWTGDAEKVAAPKKPLRLDIEAVLPPKYTWDKTLREAVKDLYSKALLAGAKARAEDIGEPPFITVVRADLAKWVRANCAEKVTRITKTGRTLMRRSLKKGMEAGESLDQMATRIKKVHGVLKNNAMTVARTEVGKALEHGAYAEAKASEVVEGHWWVPTGDDATRDSHADMAGQYRPLGKKFTTGDGKKLLHPHDPNGAGGEVINCRCILKPKIKE